jgi:hypothetical protein
MHVAMIAITLPLIPHTYVQRFVMESTIHAGPVPSYVIGEITLINSKMFSVYLSCHTMLNGHT